MATVLGDVQYSQVMGHLPTPVFTKEPDCFREDLAVFQRSGGRPHTVRLAVVDDREIGATSAAEMSLTMVGGSCPKSNLSGK